MKFPGKHSLYDTYLYHGEVKDHYLYWIKKVKGMSSKIRTVKDFDQINYMAKSLWNLYSHQTSRLERISKDKYRELGREWDITALKK